MSTNHPDPSSFSPHREGVKQDTSALPATGLTTESPASGSSERVWEIVYGLIPEDIAAFLRYDRKHPTGKQQLGCTPVALVCFFAMVVIVVVTGAIRGDQSWSEALPGILWCALFLLFGFGIFWLWSLLEGATTLWAHCRNPELRERVVFRLDREGITVTSGSGATTTFWHALERVVEDREHAFLYVAKTDVHILPKRIFADEHAFEEFVETARRYHQEARRFVRTEGQP